jgi:transposase InsO family protein
VLRRLSPQAGRPLVLWELSVVEQRYNAVQEVLGGVPVVEVAERYGVSRQSVHAWLRRYQAGGLAGLQDRSHRPRVCPHQARPAVEVAVCELRRQHPGWGATRLRHELARDGLAEVPSRATVHRILVRHGLVEPDARRRRKQRYRRWERERPMQLWQLDVMGDVRLADGRELKLVSGVDDHSRYCVVATLVERATGRAVCAAFAAALRRHGIPEEVLTDNGKQFTGRFGKPRPAEVLFDRICRENGITHRLTGVRRPTTTGKVERFHKTLRAELLGLDGPFPNLTVAQEVLDAWVEDYNHRRPHQALGLRTPADRFHTHQQDPGDPVPLLVPRELGPPCPSVPLAAVELDLVVPACGNLAVAGRQLWLGRRHAGRSVRLWIDAQVIHLSLDGQLLKTVASRFTADDLPRLTQLGASRAGPPPVGAHADQLGVPDAVEVDRVVSAAGLVGLGGRQLSVGQHHAGQRVTLRLEAGLLHVGLDGVQVKTMPSPVPAAARVRLQGARPATTAFEPPQGPVVVQRRVSCRGGIQVTGQQVQVGLSHAGKVVTVLVHEAYLEVQDDQLPLKTVARTRHKEVTRYRAAEHKPQAQ